VFAQHILVVLETKPAFPRLEIIEQMKSCTPDAPGTEMDGGGTNEGPHLALPRGKGEGKNVLLLMILYMNDTLALPVK